jgi:hypothetical protein
MALDNIAIKDGNANLFTLRSKDVSPAGDGSLQASLMLSRAYPVDYGNGGSFQISAASAEMTADLGSLSPIYSWLWAVAPQTPPNVSLALIRCVTIKAATTGTAGFDPGLATFTMYVARAFTAPDTGEITVPLTGNAAKLRTSMASSLAQIQHSQTQSLTPGTRVLDASPIGVFTIAAPTAKLTQFSTVPPMKLFEKLQGEHPLVLAQNEGFVVHATVPTTGTWTFVVNSEWDEVPIF